VVAVLAVAALVGIGAGTMAATTSTDQGRRNPAASANVPRPSDYAKRTIPASYLKLYWRVGEEYGLDWTKLAAVMQIESDHGRSQLPGVHRGTNAAGAAGPAQFVSSTWARYGVDADGSGQIDPYDPADAVTAMAAYLKASGAPQRWRLALYTYNHSGAYVRAVMDLSHRFLGAPLTARRLPGPM
jgi:membrane-bound lytic murein transglycosylase B